MWSEEFESGDEGTETSISIRVPNEEGVYDLTITAVQPQKLRKLRTQRIIVRTQSAIRRLDSKPPAARAAHRIGTRRRDQPRESSLVRAVYQSAVNAGMAGAVGQWRRGTVGPPQFGPMIQLGPAGTSPGMSWEAYPLPITNPGQPHILEIEYPSDVPQALGISLIEPNAAGAVTPIGLDSGVYVADEEAENDPQLARHRVVFWPRPRKPPCC